MDKDYYEWNNSREGGAWAPVQTPALQPHLLRPPAARPHQPTPKPKSTSPSVHS